MNYFSSKEDVFFSSANLHKKIHLSLALSKKLLIFLREEEGKAEAEGERERESLAQDYWTRLWFSFGYSLASAIV